MESKADNVGEGGSFPKYPVLFLSICHADVVAGTIKASYVMQFRGPFDFPILRVPKKKPLHHKYNLIQQHAETVDNLAQFVTNIPLIPFFLSRLANVLNC